MNDIQAWLDQGKTLADQATEGPWDADGHEITQHWSRPEPWQTIVDIDISCSAYCYGGSAQGVIRSEDAEFIADARTRLPQALNALQAVLDMHKVDPGQSHYPACSHCIDGWEAERWPCPTVRAIHDALESQQ